MVFLMNMDTSCASHTLTIKSGQFDQRNISEHFILQYNTSTTKTACSLVYIYLLKYYISQFQRPKVNIMCNIMEVNQTVVVCGLKATVLIKLQTFSTFVLHFMLSWFNRTVYPQVCSTTYLFTFSSPH